MFQVLFLALYKHDPFYTSLLYEVCSIFILILQLRKVRLRVFKQLAQAQKIRNCKTFI